MPFLLFRPRYRPRIRRRRIPLRRSLSAGDTVFFLGLAYSLVITQEISVTQGCVVEDGSITVNLPADGLSASAFANEVRLELLLWYKRQARERIKPRLDYWAQQLAVTYGRFLVTDPSSLWGSCNAVNDIRINWRIIMAPLPLMDYLLAHELCHVVHKNHSPRFWNLLATVIPDWKSRRKALRSDGRHYIL